MSFTYNRDLPFPSDNPSVDAPNMQTNTNSAYDIWAVEHITFNNTSAGKHKLITFLISQSTPALPMGYTQIYPQTFGSGASAYLENYVSAANASGTQCNGYLPFVKAMMHFTSTGVNGPITADAGYINVNIGSIVQSGVANIITVTFATPVPNPKYFLYPAYDDKMTGVTTTTLSTTTIVFSSAGRISGIFSFMVI